MELWELVARESIRDLIARYNANGDSGRFAQVAELFTEDALYDVEGIVHIGAAGVHEVMTSAARDMAGGAPSIVRHYTATTQIDVADEANATARSYWMVVMAHGLDHWGRYLDTYVQRDGRWLIAQRKVLTDGAVKDGWAAGRAQHQVP